MKTVAYNGFTSTSFTLAGGSGNDVITDYVNPQLRKAQLRGNVNVVPVYACANTHNGARPDASTNGARAVNLFVWPVMPRLVSYAVALTFFRALKRSG